MLQIGPLCVSGPISFRTAHHYTVAVFTVLHAERNWSHGQLAEELGVSRQTIYAIENDKYDPSLTLAFKMAYQFEQPIEEIFYPEYDVQK